MRARGDRAEVVSVVLGILMLAAGVPLLVPSWVLERMREPPAASKAEPLRPPVEAPGPKRTSHQESARDSGPLEPPPMPE